MLLDLMQNLFQQKRSTFDKMNGGNSKKKSQRLLLLVLVLGMAMVSVMLLHKLREGRVFGLLLKDQDRQILTLQLVLQRERENMKEAKRKLENMRAKNFLLRTQKIELANKLTQAQAAVDYLQKMQSEMETSLEEKQNQIKDLAGKAEESNISNLRLAALTELLQKKEAEVEEMKQQLKKLSTVEENNSTTPQDGRTNKDARKEGKWVKVETNVDDEPGKDGDVEASETYLQEMPANSQENQNQGSPSEESASTEVKEESNEQEKVESSQDANDNQETSGKEQKVRRSKNRGKGRRRRRGASSTREGNRRGALKTEIPEGSQVDWSLISQGQNNAEATTEASNQSLETAQKDEGKGADKIVEGEVLAQSEKSENETGGGKTGLVQDLTANIEENPVSNNQSSETAQKGEGESTDKIVEGEVVLSDKSENETGNDKTGPALDLNAVKQDEVVKEDANVNFNTASEKAEDDKATAQDEGSEEGKGKEAASAEEKSQKSENLHVDDAKNENGEDETGALEDLNKDTQSDAEEQEDENKDADADMTSVTEKSETEDATDDSQKQVSEMATDTGGETQDEESKENMQNQDGQ